jgi:hypothetical protein
MTLYVTHRPGDDAGLGLTLRADLRRLLPGTTVLAAEPRALARASLAPDDVVLVVVGPGSLPALRADAADPLRQLLARAVREERRIVPVLFQASVDEWLKTCRALPAPLDTLSSVNLFEIRQQAIPQDIQRLAESLRAPQKAVPWTDTEGRTTIRVEAAAGGPVKWSNREVGLRVVVDDVEVGALGAWNGSVEVVVEPGRHTVLVRQGPLARSTPVPVEVARGATASLVCARNVFTGGLSLARKG